MRIVFDALGSTELSGGMRLHSTEVIRGWLKSWPDDEVIVIGPEWAKTEFGDRADVRVWPNEDPIRRSFGQLVYSAVVASRERADALVSLSPIVSPLRRRLTACFQHDWRHKLNPHEFPIHQRAYRWLWEVSAKRADFNACISGKAQSETTRFVPSAHTVVIENGRDHARDWPAFERPNGTPNVVTFGHHNNKRPDLVIGALATLRRRGADAPTATVLGARGEYAETLRALATELGVADLVAFPGFVDDTTYQQIVSTASIVVMPSSDEGFGLPVAEALYLGIPAIVTSDSGMPEIFGDDVVSVAPTGDALAEAIAGVLDGALGAADVTGSELMTWADTASQLRSNLRLAGLTA
ncbi:glycosyltransferase [Microbacterium sp. SD291]|uniref:glycosyltransferase n=1 Tax=Microbacterium sp. SD291 TaxID=2782007 RepID=UPI001A97CFA4|nr:glycosyltransferase [Microbacterium sp. SD291]MBO0980998.1 glycosyltransferase [Microbacterium sp. SD291]